MCTLVSPLVTGCAYSGSLGSANCDTNCAIPATNKRHWISISPWHKRARGNQPVNYQYKPATWTSQWAACTPAVAAARRASAGSTWAPWGGSALSAMKPNLRPNRVKRVGEKGKVRVYGRQMKRLTSFCWMTLARICPFERDCMPASGFRAIALP